MVRSLHSAPVKVLAILTDKGKHIGGCSYVRITGPLSFLRDRGKTIEWCTYPQARLAAASKPGWMSQFNVIVLPRIAAGEDMRILEAIEMFQALGKVVIYEADDDYTNEHREVVSGDPLSVMRSVNAITVSTPYLREQLSKYTDKQIYLLQNTMDIEYWTVASKATERIIPSPSIGLVGSSTHYEDWKLASEALHRIAQEYPDVHFVLGNFHPDYLDDLPNLHKLPGVPYPQYPGLVSQIDIGLCPLVPDDLFNMSKSAIKAMEYWGGGAAAIATDCNVYNRVVNEENGFLVNTPDEWFNAIKTCLDNPVLARTKTAKGFEWVSKHRNMEQNSEFWWDVYTEVYKKHGGKLNERLLTERYMGGRPPNSQGRSGDHVLPVSGSQSGGRRTNPNATSASRDQRRPNRRRRPQARSVRSQRS